MTINKIITLKSVLIGLYFSLLTFVLPSFGYGQYATYLLIPLSFIFFFLARPKQFVKDIKQKEVKVYLIFILWTTISLFYSKYLDAALSTQGKIIIITILVLSILSLAKYHIKYLYAIYLGNLISLIIMTIYVFRIGVQLDTGSRFEEGELNANMYSYYIFNGIFSCFILYTQKRGNKILWLVLLITLIITSFFIILISASRGGIILFFALVILNFLAIYSKTSVGAIQKFFILLLFFIGTLYTFNYVYTNFISDSNLMARFDSLEDRESPRQYHFRKAIEIGMENPLLGVGSGNYAQIPKEIEPGSFSHNTYTEIFANYGFIGLLLYLYFLLIVIKKLLISPNYKNYYRKVLILQLLIFLFLFSVYNIFYVTYISSQFSVMLFTVIAHICLINKSKISTYN